MNEKLLTTQQAAQLLNIAVTTLYDWLSQSDYGLLIIGGECVVVEYFQTGARGQGRILIPLREILRLQELMRVKPKWLSKRRNLPSRLTFPGITVALGRPNLP